MTLRFLHAVPLRRGVCILAPLQARALGCWLSWQRGVRNTSWIEARLQQRGSSIAPPVGLSFQAHTKDS